MRFDNQSRTFQGKFWKSRFVLTFVYGGCDTLTRGGATMRGSGLPPIVAPPRVRESGLIGNRCKHQKIHGALVLQILFGLFFCQFNLIAHDCFQMFSVTKTEPAQKDVKPTKNSCTSVPPSDLRLTEGPHREHLTGIWAGRYAQSIPPDHSGAITSDR